MNIRYIKSLTLIFAILLAMPGFTWAQCTGCNATYSPGSDITVSSGNQTICLTGGTWNNNITLNSDNTTLCIGPGVTIDKSRITVNGNSGQVIINRGTMTGDYTITSNTVAVYNYGVMNLNSLSAGRPLYNYGTLNVTGSAIFDMAFTSTGSVIIGGSLTANAAMSLTGPLTVSGNATINGSGSLTSSGSGSSVSIGGSVTANQAISVSGPVTIGNGLTMNGGGSVNLGGNATITGNVTGADALTIAGAVYISGDYTVLGAGTLNLNGSLYVNGTFFINGGVVNGGGGGGGSCSSLCSGGNITNQGTINSGLTLCKAPTTGSSGGATLAPSTPGFSPSALNLSVSAGIVSASWTAASSGDGYMILRRVGAAVVDYPNAGANIPAGSTYGTTTVAGYSNGRTNTTFSDSYPGCGTVYYAVVTTSTQGTCMSYSVYSNAATSNLSVSFTPTAGSLSGNNSICGSGTTTLTVAGYAGKVSRWETSYDNSNWTSIGNQDLASITTATLTASIYYRAVITGGTSCTSVNTASYLISVTPAGNIPSAPAKTSGTECAGSSATYTATASGSPTWAWSVTGTNNTVSSFTNGVATISWHSGFSGSATVKCSTQVCGGSGWAVNSVNVTVAGNVGTPSVPVKSSGNVCPNTTAVYSSTATNASSYSWSVNGSGNSISSGGTTSTPTVSWGAGFTGNATLTVTATGCNGSTNTNSVVVAIAALGTATAPTLSSGSECVNTTAYYTATAVSGATSYTWSISGNGTLSYSGLTANVAWDGNNGGRTITVTANGCNTTSSASRNTTVYNTPNTPGNPSKTSGNECAGQTCVYSISSVPGAVSYVWSLPDGGGSITGNGLSATVVWNSSMGNYQNYYNVRVQAVSCNNNTQQAQTQAIVTGAPTGLGNPSKSGGNECANTTSNYSVSAGNGATSYLWTVSPGAASGNTISGSTGTSPTITWGSTFSGSATITFTATNCGGSTSTTYTANVTGPVGAVSTPVKTSGTECHGQTSNYSVTAPANINNYVWTLSGGGSLNQNNNTASVQWNTTGGGTYTLTCTARGCNNSTSTVATYSAIVTGQVTTPSTPTLVSGTECAGQSCVYSTTASNATSYSWSVTDGSITAGSTTGTITVLWNSNASTGSKSMNVSATGCSGTSSQNSSNRTVTGLPTGLGTPSSNGQGCGGNSTSYSCNSASGGTVSYTWTVSGTGNTFASTGTNTYTGSSNSVTVNWATGFSGSASVSVYASNCAGNTSTLTSSSVNVSNVAPALSSGSQCYLTSATYAANGNNISSYSWSLSGGGTITSLNNQSSVTVLWGATGGTYNLTLNYNGGNGCSGSKVFSAVVGGVIGTPSTPTKFSGTECINSTATYTTTAANAISYAWTVGTGGTIASGNGTNTITVNWNGTSGTRSISVTGTDCKGVTSLPATYNATVVPAPVITTGPAISPALNPATPARAASGTTTTFATTASDAVSYTYSVNGSGNSITNAGVATWGSSFTGNATVTVTVYGCGSTSTTGTISVNVQPAGTWWGYTSSAWATADNWAGGVPSTSIDVNITNSFGANQPSVAASGSASCKALTVGSSASLTLSANSALTIAGMTSVSGTFTSATNSSVTFAGNSSQTIPALAYNNLSFSGSGARVLASSGTIQVAGTFDPGTGNTYTTTGSSIEFNGNGAQSIPSFTYNNLGIAGSGTKSLAGDVTVTNTLNLSAGTLALNGRKLTVQTADAPITRTSGTIDASASGSIIAFGSAGNTGGAAFTLPNSVFGSTTVANLTVNRTNGLSLGNQSLTISGALTLTAGTFNLNSNSLTLNGTVSGSGLLSSTSASNLTIGGSGALGTLSFASNSNINNLAMNRSTSGTATLGSNLGVAGTITMTNGIFSTGTYKITLGSSASFASETDNSYVYGKSELTRTMTQNSLNTFGNIGVEINAVGANPGSTYVLREIGATITGYNSNPGLKRKYTITPTVDANLNATLTFKYLANSDELNNVDGSRLTLYKSTNSGATWLKVSNCTLNQASKTLTATGINSFSDWAAASKDAPLPVTLLNFSGEVIGKHTHLNWSTASEHDNQGFTVERSGSGKEFARAGFVAGAGNSSNIKNYSFIDSLNYHDAYYRLRQTDFDGKEEVFPTIYIRSATKTRAAFEAMVYPNPVQDVAGLNIQSTESEIITVNVVNLNGELVHENTMSLEPGLNFAKIDCSGLPAGIYTIRIESQTGIKVLKAVKQ
ncbi:MAG: T9SS type A sorting domain-containing protein [Bacteroidota bacterium]